VYRIGNGRLAYSSCKLPFLIKPLYMVLVTKRPTAPTIELGRQHYIFTTQYVAHNPPTERPEGEAESPVTSSMRFSFTYRASPNHNPMLPLPMRLLPSKVSRGVNGGHTDLLMIQVDHTTATVLNGRLAFPHSSPPHQSPSFSHPTSCSHPSCSLPPAIFAFPCLKKRKCQSGRA